MFKKSASQPQFKGTMLCEYQSKDIVFKDPYIKEGKLYAHCAACRMGRKCIFDMYGKVSETDYHKMFEIANTSPPS